MKYKEILNTLYKRSLATDGCPPDNKIQFLGSTVFDFTLYSNEMYELFGRKMIEVILCIIDETTFDYQELSNENYINFLTMVNMPFLVDKLNWGSSIRGAWFENSESYIICGEINIPKNELTIFMNELIEWSKND